MTDIKAEDLQGGTVRLVLRILLALIVSPLWLPAYIAVLIAALICAVAINIVLFIGKGKLDFDYFRFVGEFATLRMFKEWK